MRGNPHCCLFFHEPHPPSQATHVSLNIAFDTRDHCHHISTVTTIHPQLGILSHDTDRPIRIADLPGLVEGAHANVGMGHKFLRHIERTRLLLLVVDINGFQLSSKLPERDACETIDLLVAELEAYQGGLSQRPSLLVVNKMDVQHAETKLQLLRKHLDHHSKTFEVVPVSAMYNRGIDDLKTRLADLLQP